MLGSISPVGEASRNQRWWLTATAYTVASMAAGAVVGMALGAAGAAVVVAVPLDLTARLLLLAVVLVTAAALDAGVLGVHLPTWHRQVDERWLGAYRGWVYGAGFGAQLGVGFATIVPSAAVYAALAAAALSATWHGGLLVGTMFGLVRSVPLLLMGRVRSVERLHAVTRKVVEAGPPMHRATVVAQGTLAVVTAVAAVAT